MTTPDDNQPKQVGNPIPYKKYLVYVEGRDWTDGMFREDSPKGWCHKWASEDFLFNAPNRGVIAFQEMPPKP